MFYFRWSFSPYKIVVRTYLCMEFCIAIILIIMCRISCEYLDIKYRQSIVQSDYKRAFYISKDFRVKNKYTAPTYTALQNVYKLSLSIPKLFTGWLNH